MTIRVVELFAGIGAQAEALKELGLDYEVVATCEIDKHAINGYQAIHGPVDNLGDITKVEHLPECDLVTYSFPCVPAGTLIATVGGYVPVEDIKIGMGVLTHKNRYKRVVKTMCRSTDEMYEIKALGTPSLRITGEHPLYVLRNGELQWVKTKDLKRTDMLTVNIPNPDSDVSRVPSIVLEKGMCWMLGRYVADGYINPRLYNSTEFSIGVAKSDEFDAHIPECLKGMKKCLSHPTCYQYRVADKEFQILCHTFGNGAANKRLPSWIMALPQENLQEFFDGYMSGDGHVRDRMGSTQYMFSTVSRELFLGMQAVVARLYGVECSCYIRHDDRSETFNDTYNAQFTLNGTHPRGQKIVEDKICVQITSIEKFETDMMVYNMEVDEDNSYTCENIIVHNCQDLSAAGKRRGMGEGSGTRSSLLWEVGRLLEDMKERGCLPETLLMENVDAILNEQNFPHFMRWVTTLGELGYTSSYEIMNAKDYGTPQSRRRCFMVSSLTNGKFVFPAPCPDGRVLRDVLEKDVPESYYLSEERVAKFERHKIRQEENGRGFGWSPKSVFDDYMNPVTTNPNRNATGNFIDESGVDFAGSLNCSTFNRANKVMADTGNSMTVTAEHGGINFPKIIVEGELEVKGFIDHDKRVHSKDGLSPCLSAQSNTQRPKIIVDDHVNWPADNSEGYMVAKEGDALVMARPHAARSTVMEGTSFALTCGSNIGVVLADKDTVPEMKDGEVSAMHTPGREEKRQNGPRFKNDGTSFTVTATDKDGVAQNTKGKLRIRYLTPRECLRLQAFPEDAIDRLMAAESKSQCYKLAGNSIAVCCLKAIFKGIYIDRTFVKSGRQISLNGWF